MILKRLAGHIRNQDWLVVFIEIMIVVVGIFIGLQVDDWNQQRQGIALEREYLARLQGEMDRLLEVEQGRLRWNEVRIDQVAYIADVLENQQLPEEGVSRFEYGLYLIGLVNRARLSWGTVEELRNTGNIQLIRDLGLRQAITDVENEFKWHDRYITEAGDVAWQYRKELNEHYRVITSPRPAADIALELELDPSVFWSNRTLANKISWLADYQRRADHGMRANLDRVEALRDQIAAVRMEQFGDG